ncbi:MAG: dephospho-CoA kinase [Eubacteriales bacterium]|nr:dephospho-CoA kinase [Eubacteriales bacterium]
MWVITGMKRIKVLGITGGVGAGKSTILNYLSETYHAAVLQLDNAAHRLMEPGQECYRRILELFGEDILDEEGRIDRGKLYQAAFSEGKSPEILNRTVHPAVKEYVLRWIEEQRQIASAPFLVLEAALLLEDGYSRICDEIWFIRVDENVRRERLMSSRGYTEKKIEEILKNQKTEKEFQEECQFTVDNSNDILENTYEQIDRGLREHEFV